MEAATAPVRTRQRASTAAAPLASLSRWMGRHAQVALACPGAVGLWGWGPAWRGPALPMRGAEAVLPFHSLRALPDLLMIHIDESVPSLG